MKEILTGQGGREAHDWNSNKEGESAADEEAAPPCTDPLRTGHAQLQSKTQGSTLLAQSS